MLIIRNTIILNIEEVLLKLSKISDNSKLKKKLDEMTKELDKLVSQKNADKFGKGMQSSNRYSKLLIIIGAKSTNLEVAKNHSGLTK